jgi:hypothetical protein
MRFFVLRKGQWFIKYNQNRVVSAFLFLWIACVDGFLPRKTAMGMLAHGLMPWGVTDAVLSREQKKSALGLVRMESLGAAVGPAEMIIYELSGRAPTPEFKVVLPHIL